MNLNLGGFVGALVGAALGFFVGAGSADYGNAGTTLVVGLIIGAVGGNYLWAALQRK